MTVTTPPVGRVLRRGVFWVLIALVAVAATLVTAAVFRTASTGDALGADNPTPTGAKALAEVLRQQGVDVRATTNLDDTAAAAGGAGGAGVGDVTVLVYDPGALLDDERLARLGDLGADLVLVEPDFSALQALAPSVAQAGVVDETFTADCPVAAVTAAGSVTGSGTGYRLLDDDDDAATPGTACLGSGDDVYSLVQLARDGSTVTVLGTSGALTNERIDERGNAALALTLLGSNDTLVWYLPSFADVSGDTAPTLAELTPSWLTPLLLLGFVTVAAATIWRGRRLGALVIENLPVTVRASETMEGRARLYAASGARLHALDALRIGTINRLAPLLGLPRLAEIEEVIAATASVTGADPLVVRRLLVDATPASDRDLVRLSDELLLVEKSVAERVRPSARPSGRE